MKKVWKGILIFVAVLIGVLVLGVGFLTIVEYRPAPVESLEAAGGEKPLAVGDSIRLLTFNIGFGCLSKDEDFFMDGGKKVAPESRELPEENMAGIAQFLQEEEADICLLQEVDVDSTRSFHINEKEYLEEALGIKGILATNFRSFFVPYPIPPIGKVDGGILTLSQYPVREASRISLPVPFKWPVRIANLKRCLLVARLPIEGTDKELVIINLHLEAYDNGEGKIAQSKMLNDVLAQEYEKGNYVIAGGDFNQTLDTLLTSYPRLNPDGWLPGTLSNENLPEHFSYAMTDNVPTCRTLAKPYSGSYEDTQLYILDGFIFSDNLRLDTLENVDLNFRYADHNPVLLEVTLLEEPEKET